MTSTTPDLDPLLLQALAALRPLGLYADKSGLETAALLQHVRSYYGLDWPDVLETAADRTPAAFDQLLVLPDEARVWCHDLECVYGGAQAYATALSAWAAISRGAFQPADVVEYWRSPAGPVELTWAARGTRFTFQHRDGHDDFLHHLALLEVINRSLADTGSGYQFAACDDYPGDCRFITVLRAEEQQPLLRRGWSFC